VSTILWADESNPFAADSESLLSPSVQLQKVVPRPFPLVVVPKVRCFHHAKIQDLYAEELAWARLSLLESNPKEDNWTCAFEKGASPMANETATTTLGAARRTSMSLHLACGVLMAAFFLADLAMPLGVAMGVPYVAVVLASLWSPEKRFTVLVAAFSSFFVIIAFLYKPPAGELWKVLCNRALALFAIWVTTVLALGRKRIEDKREKAVKDREKALEEIKILRGFLPICASCKKIRDDKGYWTQMEAYIRDHSEAEFSHGICPECVKKLYPEFHRDDVP
jgi:hypothetical protein